MTERKIIQGIADIACQYRPMDINGVRPGKSGQEIAMEIIKFLKENDIDLSSFK